MNDAFATPAAFATGEVPTRESDWHDFFNALAWCAWPRTKCRCASCSA